ncbi:MAG: hypothetical protein AVDCRST_MAG05-1314, partial [uncultured Rubrobacteraceae bacterium]
GSSGSSHGLVRSATGRGLPRGQTALLMEGRRARGAGDHVPVHQHRALHRHEARPRGDDARAPARRALDHLPHRALRDRRSRWAAGSQNPEARGHRSRAAPDRDVPGQRERCPQRDTARRRAAHPAVAQDADAAPLHRDGVVDRGQRPYQEGRTAAHPRVVRNEPQEKRKQGANPGKQTRRSL